MRALCLPFVCLTSVAGAQLTPMETKGIEEALYVGNMTLSDLDLPREPSTAPYRLPLVELALARPLEGASALMAMHASSGGSMAANLATLSSRVFGDRIGEGQPAGRPADVGTKLPEPFRRPLGNLAGALREANGSLQQALSRLTPDQRRRLLEALPGWVAEDSALKIEFVKRPRPHAREVERLIALVDLPAIRLAARRLAGRLGSEVRALQTLARTMTLKETIRLNAGGLRIELSGQGSDVHASRDTALCIDLGGNDTYTGRYGAGVGYASILLDLGGDDRYRVPDLSLGAGLLGIGLACDLGEGDDVYQARALALGSGLAGVGALYDAGGRDTYRSGALTQGFGALGMGVLLDAAGDDSYTAGSWSQGAGRTGGAGWLADARGDETYRGGARGGQGYASGHNGTLGGGAGLFSDLGGDDAYVGGSGCQGTARISSVGSLYDASGADTYSAQSTAQASADRASVAMLFDLAGDDLYAAHSGTSLSNAASDSLAFQVDRAGNDLYITSSGPPGSASVGGVALFLDGSGSDVYPRDHFRGPEANARGLSMFVDLGSDREAPAATTGRRAADGIRSASYEQGNRCS